MNSVQYRYCWGNNPKRAGMQGRVCRVVCRGAKNSAMVEFTDNGQREVVSRNALRRDNAVKSTALLEGES